jgi:hypothetical protein
MNPKLVGLILAIVMEILFIYFLASGQCVWAAFIGYSNLGRQIREIKNASNL